MGVAPIKGHDIPGVRSFEQLKLAYHYHPNEYDGSCEIDNKLAYSVMQFLN